MNKDNTKGRKRESGNDGDLPASKKHRGDNWTQEDTNLLCNLLVTFGQKGILNKETNGATNDIKKREWSIIRSHFNTDPKIKTQREVPALIGRHKKIVTALRQFTTCAKQSALQTGGGPANTPPVLKIEMTGEVLQLKNYYGHLLTGLESFDSDAMPTDFGQMPPIVADSSKILLSQPGKGTDTTFSCSEETSTDDCQNLREKTPPSQTVNSSPIADMCAALSTEAVGTTTVPQPCDNTNVGQDKDKGQEKYQFFPTNGQRRRPIRNQKSSLHSVTVAEMRQQMITKEESRLAEFHELRMNSFRLEHAERISEIQQRKKLQEALAVKQMEFWQSATDALQELKNSRNFADGVAIEKKSNVLGVGDIITFCKAATNASDETRNCGDELSVLLDLSVQSDSVVSEALRNVYHNGEIGGEGNRLQKK